MKFFVVLCAVVAIASANESGEKKEEKPAQGASYKYSIESEKKDAVLIPTYYNAAPAPAYYTAPAPAAAYYYQPAPSAYGYNYGYQYGYKQPAAAPVVSYKTVSYEAQPAAVYAVEQPAATVAKVEVKHGPAPAPAAEYKYELKSAPQYKYYAPAAAAAPIAEYKYEVAKPVVYSGAYYPAPAAAAAAPWAYNYATAAATPYAYYAGAYPSYYGYGYQWAK